MRIALPLVCFSLLLVGCTSAGPYAHPLRDAMEDYRSIEKGMTKEEVVARLGQPDKMGKAESLYWRDKGSPGINNYVELSVSYDEDGRVVETKVSKGMDHYSSVQ